MLTIGNIINTERDETGIVLAVRKDGTKAKVYRYGKDFESWLPVEWLTVETAGNETCYKCAGSGLYYFGGAVVNGVYTGKTGPCYGCEGTGEQSDDDRRRCHYYWHRKVEGGEDMESPLEPSPKAEVKPARPKIRSKKRTVKTAHGERSRTPATDVVESDKLIDCKGCGTLHREDTMCPW